MSYVMDETENSTLKAKAKADAIAGVYNTPFPVVNGSALDKLKKTAFNDAYAVAHGSKPSPAEPEDASEKTIEEQYEEKYGKKPHWKMKPETIQAALEE